MAKFSKSIEDAFLEKPQKTGTWSDIDLKELYTPADIEGTDYNTDIGDAGQFPYTRGIFSNMYRGKYWTRRQMWGWGTPGDTNKQLKFLLEKGNTGLAVFKDNPTGYGIDSDHPMAVNEVGVVGVPFCSIEDMEAVVKDIPLDKVSMNLLCASISAPVILAQYLAVAEKRGISAEKLRGTLTNDPITGGHCGGLEPNPLNLCVKSAVDIIEYCTRHMPLWNATYVSGCYNIRESGLTAPQEIAFGFAIAMAYINGALERGMDIDDFAPKANFFCWAGIDIFEEICKFRAMRRMWAKLMRDRYGAKNPKSMRFRFAVQTSGSSLTHQQPLNNIVRISYEALAAVLGGAQSISCCCYDEAVCLPTSQSQQVSLATQQILAYETGVANTADPLGGSYFIESLTNTIEKEAEKVLAEIEEKGGMVEAVKTGWTFGLVEKLALRHQREMEKGERLVVGVNAFAAPEEEQDLPGGVFRVPSDTEKIQIEKVRHLKATRDKEKVKRAVNKLKERALLGEQENLMEAIIDAVKAYATIEEIQGTIRQAYGYSWDPWGVRQSPFSD